VLENIVRHLEQGEGVLQAALNGSNEIGFTILSMTLSLAAVFLPVLFMGGVLGRLLHEFAVTIMSAILVSGFVSLTLTPMLCSRFLLPHQDGHEKHGSMFNLFERMQQGMTDWYDRSLKIVLRHKLATMAVSLVLVVGTVYLAIVIPKGFLPSADIAQINGTTEAIEGASYDSMLEHQTQIAKIVQDDPSVLYVLSQIGTGGRSLNQGSLNIYLKPRSQRPQVDQVIEELRPKLAAVPGMTVFLRNDPPIRIGGIQSKALYQFTMQAASTTDLFSASQDFLSKMQKLPGLEDVTSDLQIKNPQINVIIDRDKSGAGRDGKSGRGRVVLRLWLPPGFDDFRAEQSVSGNPGTGTAVSAGRQRPIVVVRALKGRAARASERGRETDQHVRAAVCKPPRTTPSGDDVFQPQAGDLDRRRSERDQRTCQALASTDD